MITRISLLVTVLLLIASALPVYGEGAYLGVNMDVSKAPRGIVLYPVEDGPAYKCGLREGDIIISVEGKPLATDDAKLIEEFRNMLMAKNPGDKFSVRITRLVVVHKLLKNGVEVPSTDPIGDYQKAIASGEEGDFSVSTSKKREELDIEVTIGERPKLGASFPTNLELDKRDLGDCPERALARRMCEENGLTANLDDILKRLAATHNGADAFRRNLMAYIHREPWAAENVSLSMEHMVNQIVKVSDAFSVIGRFGDIATGAKGSEALPSGNLKPATAKFDEPLKTGIRAKEHAAQMQAVLEQTHALLLKAFAPLSDAERKFIADNRNGLTDAFLLGIYLQSDENIERRKVNLKLLEVAARVDYAALNAAAISVSRLFDAEYLHNLYRDLQTAYMEKLGSPVCESFETPYGRIVFAGIGDNWHAGVPTAIIVDLGGDDLYTNGAGSGTSLAVQYADPAKPTPDTIVSVPMSLVIDFGGNDMYSAGARHEVGSGSMGIGMVCDMGGNDTYVGNTWGIGSALFGAGAVLDRGGNDTYRGDELCESAAIFGYSLLMDTAGDDRYEGRLFCQSLAGSGGVSLLLDEAGDDSYYSGGLHPTNYGDKGLFDAWSQGSAIGFRGYASGGIAVFSDKTGNDRYDAGHFSQGGGYYYGFGSFSDGSGNDWYRGSRYNQGFSAHQAVGVFVEHSGDDYYRTVQAVAQGLAWDECVTLFLELGGKDTYYGAGGFSLAASAHNSICMFYERDGNDQYYLGAGPARAGGNDYHGGTSLSYFIDYKGFDQYSNNEYGDDLLRLGKEHFIFCDTSDGIAPLLAAPTADWPLKRAIGALK